ncbi:DUF6778 family protein [Aestuariivita boseongensis]|uniref:DUF6778 family protein n=1 Tax=Aestuariivita boseongensis TaxID=1470562 RepID=UPI0006805E8D|nr:DUF6778 family protein [Aestuariivita boseongensis]
MNYVRIIALLAVGLGLSACAAVDTVTRNAPFETQTVSQAQRVSVPAADVTAPVAQAQAPVRIQNVLVNVPRSLKVSEANRYLPAGDIVWRGDPIGDRHAQVQAIFETAMLRGAQTIQGERPVDLLINVKRFHALTEKARYTTGGVHNIVFDLALADPVTGDIVAPWREIRADLDAFGGQQAILAEARGETQKVRITAFLAEVLRQELTVPGGYKTANLGLIQVLNQF